MDHRIVAVAAFMVAAPVVAALGGCGSITRGTTEPVGFISEPPGATLTTSMAYACAATPCTIEVGRSDEFVATFAKPGYRSASVPVKTEVVGNGAAGVAGNVLFGGVIGLGVDAATGAAFNHTPNPVSVTLVPDALPSAQRANRRKRAGT